MVNTRKILLGLSLLGATTLSGFSAPAFAKPSKDVKEARKDVKKAHKEFHKADSREERRDAREDLREERRDLREEKREHHSNNGRRSHGRPTQGPGSPNYNRRDRDRDRDRDRPDYSNSTRTLQGVVINDTRGNDFVIRTNSGRIVRVVAVNGESGRISRGDTVSVMGRYSGSSFNATSVSILRDR